MSRILPLVIMALLFHGAFPAVAQRPLPRVLIIGDSISIGYMPPLVELMKGKAEVIHNEGNAASTLKGLSDLDAWLGEGHWDVIHFNFGLHDLKYVDDTGKNAPTNVGHVQVPIPQYRKNLKTIVKRLQETDAAIIFATTTPFPKELKNNIRIQEDQPKYNAAALKVMKKHDVRVNDLDAFIAPCLAELQHPNDVHFTEAGSKLLAEEVARLIQRALDERATPAETSASDTYKAGSATAQETPQTP